MPKSGCFRWVVLLGVLVIGAQARAAEIATTEQLRRWVVGLMDADPAMRETSRMALTGLSREELGTLAAVVHEFRPLESQLEAALRDVVEHVYLTADDYEKEDRGFLGITMPPPPLPGAAAEPEVVVQSRMPGFVGYRMLQDGDVILDIVERALSQPIQRNVFCDAVRTVRPGQLVHLRVLRRGTTLRIPVRMDARPRDRTGDVAEYQRRVDDLLSRRADEAERFWKTAFEGDKASGERTATVEQK